MRRVIEFAALLPRRLLMGLVQAYRFLFSPWVGQSCRFTPTCSRYALDALERHGAVAGGVYTVWRVLRCHPGCAGGCDPVPDRKPWERAPASPSSGPARLRAGLLPESGADPRATRIPPDPENSKTPS